MQGSDLWALAVVAYEALTGKLPFEAESVGGLFVEITQHRFIPPSRRGLPASMVGWAERAFAPLVQDRFASPPEVLDALVAAMGGEEKRASRETLQP